MPESSSSHTFPTLDELAVLLPPYEIQCCIYEGLTSAIYIARQTALERIVMIRIMPEPEPESVRLLLERLRQRARLVDPKIVGVFDFGRTMDGPLYLVTEHVDGDLLDRLIYEKQVTPKHAFHLANQLCDTLQLVHAQHIVHGALSSRTVLVTKEWQLKLTGIGMSETTEGELSWMEESNATVADDIHGLGSVIHEMFSGELPSPTGEISPALPPAFAQVIQCCLTSDLTRRYARPEYVRAALTEALHTEKKTAAAAAQKTVVAARPTNVPSPHPPSVPRPPTRREPPRAPSLLKRIDRFIWSFVRTSLHLFIIGGALALLAAMLLLKDRIVFKMPDEENQESPSTSSSTKSLAEARAPVKPNLGPLPAAPTLPAGSAKPAVKVPVRPLTPKESQYLATLKKELDAARDEKRNDDLPALRREIQRVQNGRGIPAKDEADLPAVVKHLREEYRKAS